MGVNNKIRALMSMDGKKTGEVADYLGVSSQVLSNKLYRNSFSAEDLIKFAACLDCELAFTRKDGQKIVLDLSDIQQDEPPQD